MTVQFRNLDFDTTQPLDQWPAEAIETVMDRGSLSDWRARSDRRLSPPLGSARLEFDSARLGGGLVTPALSHP